MSRVVCLTFDFEVSLSFYRGLPKTGFMNIWLLGFLFPAVFVVVKFVYVNPLDVEESQTGSFPVSRLNLGFCAEQGQNVNRL